MKRALVLSGGGAKGSFQLGVLEHLIINRKMDFEIICGVSVGALNASFLAQAPFDPNDEGKSNDNLQRTFLRLKNLWLEDIQGSDDIYTSRFGKDAGVIFGADSIYDPFPLKKLLANSVNPELVKNSGRKLKIGYVSLEVGDYRKADQKVDAILEYVLASGTMPYYFPPVELKGEHLVDGGLRDVTPLGLAFEETPDEIYVVFASPFFIEKVDLTDNWLGTKVNFTDYLSRSIEIMCNQIYQNDLKVAKMLNVILKSLPNVKNALAAEFKDTAEYKAWEKLHFCPIHEIKPAKFIIRDSLDFSRDKIRANYDYGKEVAKELFPL